VKISLPTACPYQDLFLRTWYALTQLPRPT